MNYGTKSILIALSALLGLSACDGTDTGNPFTQPLIVDAHSSRPGEVSIQVAGGDVVVTEAWLSIDDVGLSEDCGGTSEARSGAIGVADHAADEALHVDFLVKTTSYCEMQVPWSLAVDGAQVPAGVVGTAISLAGQTKAGTDFVLRSALTGTVVVDAVGESFALAETSGGLFLGFDLATWLSGIDLDTASLENDGSILIDANTNAGMLTTFEGNVAAGLELYRDADNSGRPDSVDDVVLARGQP